MVGAAYYPGMDDMLNGAIGLGAWWNGKRAHVSPVNRLDQAYISFTDPGGFILYNRQEIWERLMRATYVRAGWNDAYGYLLAATGRTDIMLDPVMNPWDCGPFPPIFQEAGGYFGDWQGKVTLYGGEALATSRVLLPQVLEVIHGSKS
jgi:myo-inositol-1(or 4)-monophosphatase